MHCFHSSDDIIRFESGIDADASYSTFEDDFEQDAFEFSMETVTEEAVEAVRSIPNLRKVLLCGFGGTLSAEFITALNHNHKLEALEVSECDIGLAGFCAIGRIISDPLSVLKELIIQHGSCNDDVIQCLQYDLAGSTSLKILNLGDNNITSRGFQMLHDALASPHSSLTELDLSDCDISSAENTELFSGLANSPRLQKLVLSGNKISPTNAMKLSTGLKSNVLLHLDLSVCSIDDDSAKTLASGLASNTSLKELVMDDMIELNSNTWSIVLFSLRTSSMPLEFINLSENNISDETCDDLVDLLVAKKETLTFFLVDGVSMTSVGWEKLASAFLTHIFPKLMSVTAGNDHFDDDVAIAFAEGLKDQPSFSYLRLCNVNLTNIGREVIQKFNKRREMSHCAM